MAKTIKEEIIDYLKENDMYFVEEYDEDGFPVDDEAYDLIGNMTNAEFCDSHIDAMEYIADIQRKIDIEKACKAYCKQCALIYKETLTSGFVACAQYIDRKNCPNLQDLIKQMETE